MPVKYGSSQPPSGRCVSTSQRTRVRRGLAVRLAGGVEPEQRPGGLRRRRGAAPAPGRVAVRAEVLAEPAVGVLHALEPVDRGVRRSGARPGRRRRAPARRRRCRRRGSRPSGRTTSRRAPARAAATRAPRRAAASPAASLVGEHLDHVGGDVGARRVGDRAEVAERRASRRGCSCCRRRTRPSRRRAALHAEHPVEPAVGRPARRRGRRGAAPARRRRCRRRRGSCRSRTRTGSRRRRAPAGARPSRRATRTSLRRRASRAPRTIAGCSAARPASSSAITASAVSQTGDWHASMRRPCSSSIVKRVEPGERARDHRMVERVAERVQRDDRPDPRRLDAAPGAVALLALDDPALGGAERAAAQRPRPAAARRRAGRGRAGRRRVPRHRSAAPAATPRRAARRSRTATGRRGPQRGDDRQRDDRLPRPAAEGVDGERRARRAAGSARAGAPAPPSHDQSDEQREPHAREDARRARRRRPRG